MPLQIGAPPGVPIAPSQLATLKADLAVPALTTAQAAAVAAAIPNGAAYATTEVIAEVLADPSATTVVHTGPGLYAGYRCTTAAGNITVYDSLTATGKVLVPLTALTTGSFPIFGAGHAGKLIVDIGVTVVLSGAAVVYAGVEGP